MERVLFCCEQRVGRGFWLLLFSCSLRACCSFSFGAVAGFVGTVKRTHASCAVYDAVAFSSRLECVPFPGRAYGALSVVFFFKSLRGIVNIACVPFSILGALAEKLCNKRAQALLYLCACLRPAFAAAPRLSAWTVGSVLFTRSTYTNGF